MNQIVQRFGLLMAMLCLIIPVSASDFEADGIAYTITSLTDLTLSVDRLVYTDLTEVRIPESVVYKNKTLKVTRISYDAFRENVKLNAIYLPNTIESIGNRAFMNDSNLTIINLPESLTQIMPEAFYGCSSITTFSIPEGIQFISNGVFYGCKSLLSIKLNSSIKGIGNAAFQNSGLQSINIPSSVTSLGKYVFAGTNLESVHLPSGIDIIPDGCFYNCSKLREVTLSSSVINASAFRNCIALQHISLPENLTTIGNRAFDGCSKLTEFSIPSKVISIEPTILWNCPNISKLTIGRSLKGLPVKDDCESLGDLKTHRALGSEHYLNNSYEPTHKTHLQALKEFVITDAETEFSIKGFYINEDTIIPSFSNIDLDYYYVGRPLIDIHNWYNDKKYEEFSISRYINRGFGRIKKLEINGSCTSVPFFYQKIDTLKLGKNIEVFDIQNH